MGQIAKLRVAARFPALSDTAIDMFGPLKIRLGRKTLKEPHAITFTCMTTREVHLELVTDKKYRHVSYGVSTICFLERKS